MRSFVFIRVHLRSSVAKCVYSLSPARAFERTSLCAYRNRKTRGRAPGADNQLQRNRSTHSGGNLKVDLQHAGYKSGPRSSIEDLCALSAHHDGNWLYRLGKHRVIHVAVDASRNGLPLTRAIQNQDPTRRGRIGWRVDTTVLIRNE